MTLLGQRRQSLRWLTGNINHVLPFFKNWIFINFLKCTNVRLRESSPIIFEMWWNLLPRVFMPILLLLLLKISNFSCLPVQIMLLRSVTCSEVQFSLISLIVLCKWREVWYDMIWAGVHFLHILWIVSNEISALYDIMKLLRTFAEIERRDCFKAELSPGVNHNTEL